MKAPLTKCEEQVYEVLAALPPGTPCPTNSDLEKEVGVVGLSKQITALIRKGWIERENIREQNTFLLRRLRIVETGHWTGWTDRSPLRDKLLAEARIRAARSIANRRALPDESPLKRLPPDGFGKAHAARMLLRPFRPVNLREPTHVASASSAAWAA